MAKLLSVLHLAVHLYLLQTTTADLWPGLDSIHENPLSRKHGLRPMIPPRLPQRRELSLWKSVSKGLGADVRLPFRRCKMLGLKLP